MDSHFTISSTPIDLDKFRSRMIDQGCGAYVQFEGWVRDNNEGREVSQLAYEVYEPLAVREGNRVIEEAFEKFDIRLAKGIHSEGLLALTDPAVVVGVSSPHRDAAFLAARYIIDQVKIRLPIWKKEFYSDGTVEWVNCRQCATALHG
jgi:molybdopterin synthase catalytic subunit